MADDARTLRSRGVNDKVSDTSQPLMDGRMKWAKHISSKNLNGSGFILIY